MAPGILFRRNHHRHRDDRAGTGSDLQGIKTRAVRDGDDWVLNGSKTFITNGINADLVIVVACTDPEKGAQGFSLLVVERGMPGFERGRNLDKIGLDAQDTAELSFDDVRVPAANMLGEEGLGFIYLMQNLPQERLSIAVVAAAAMEQVLEDTIQYCRDRKAFGKPIGRFQNSRFELAELSTEALLAGCSWTSASSCSTSVPSPCRSCDGQVLDY